eukprot:SAG11_NODE_29441_length_310_cov_7.663507_1_plen_89_part_01
MAKKKKSVFCRKTKISYGKFLFSDFLVRPGLFSDQTKKQAWRENRVSAGKQRSFLLGVNQAAGTVKSPAKNGQKKKIGFLQENEDLIWK